MPVSAANGLLAALLSFAVLSGCGGTTPPSSPAPETIAGDTAASAAITPAEKQTLYLW